METPHVFGAQEHLVGIANVPRRHRRDVAVVMVTPGMLHQAGPYRLHVDLARAFGERRIVSLRFDLSGIGESLGVGSSGNSLDRATFEIQQALDLLQEQYGVKEFILFGLCSGADDGFHAACKDDRIGGVILMDGCGYRTPGFYWHHLFKHYLRRGLSLKRWASRLAGLSTREGEPASLQLGNDIREFPSRADAAIALQGLVNRGAKMHFVYTGGVANYFNHASQFEHMFCDVRFRGKVSTAYYPEMDHVAMLVEDREKLIAGIMQWVGQTWATSAWQQQSNFDPFYGARLRSIAATPAWGI